MLRLKGHAATTKAKQHPMSSLHTPARYMHVIEWICMALHASVAKNARVVVEEALAWMAVQTNAGSEQPACCLGLASFVHGSNGTNEGSEIMLASMPGSFHPFLLFEALQLLPLQMQKGWLGHPHPHHPHTHHLILILITLTRTLIILLLLLLLIIIIIIILLRPCLDLWGGFRRPWASVSAAFSTHSLLRPGP